MNNRERTIRPQVVARRSVAHCPERNRVISLTCQASAAVNQRRRTRRVRRGPGPPCHRIGLVVLLVVQALNIYKPHGLTRYGQRRQHKKSDALPSSGPQ